MASTVSPDSPSPVRVERPGSEAERNDAYRKSTRRPRDNASDDRTYHRPTSELRG